MSTTPAPTAFTSGGKSIPAGLFIPSGVKNGGVVIIAYGSDGLKDTSHGPWKTMIEGYANDLARRGFVALIPDYFAGTGTVAPINPQMIPEMIARHRSEWQATIADAVTFAKTVGASMGRELDCWGSPSAAICVCDFGPLPRYW